MTNLNDLDKEIQSEQQIILQSKIKVARLKAAKFTNLKNYEFLRTQEEATELLNILVKFPKIHSPREIQVIFYISKEWTAKQMANAMAISERTIKFHKSNIFRKLNITGERELMKKYFNERTSLDILPSTKCL